MTKVNVDWFESGRESTLKCLYEDNRIIMGKRENYEDRTTKLITPIIEKNEFELVDVEFVKEAGENYLRAYIDKPGGITIDDCELVSRALSDKLDEEDFIAESYILEVSSPGLGRALKKENDYRRAVGKDVDVKLFRAVDKVKEFTGTLKAYTDDTATIEIAGEEKVFKKTDMASIKMSIDF